MLKFFNNVKLLCFYFQPITCCVLKTGCDKNSDDLTEKDVAKLELCRIGDTDLGYTTVS